MSFQDPVGGAGGGYGPESVPGKDDGVLLIDLVGDPTGGDPGGVCGERSEGTRQRTFTEKGKAYAISNAKLHFNAAVTKWNAASRLCDTLVCEAADIERLLQSRKALENTLTTVIDMYHQLCQLVSPDEEPKLTQELKLCESTTLILLQKVTQQVSDLRLETGSAMSGHSVRSKGSVASKGSARSVSSHMSISRAEAAAEAATVEVELRFIEQKVAHEKLELQRRLDVARAKVCALDAIENLEYQPLPGTKPDRSEMFDFQSRPVLKPDTEEFIPLVQPMVKPRSKTERSEMFEFQSTPVLRPEAQEFVPLIQPQVQQENFVTETLRVLTSTLAEQANIGRFPVPEPGIFTGDPLQYPGWKTAFQVLVEQKGIPARERIYYLKRYLGGAAKEAVEGYFLLPTAEAFEAAKKLLEERYGDNFTVANAFRDKLERWPKVPQRDGKALRRLSDFLMQCAVAKVANPSLGVLDDERENKRILGKLPDWMVTRWARVVHGHREEKQLFPTFAEFVRFVAKEAAIACDPVTSDLIGLKDVHATKSKDNDLQSSRSLLSDTGEGHRIEKCVICEKGNHPVNTCREFLGQSMEERNNLVVKKGLCYGCLKTGHLSRYCKARLTCGECERKHPSSLHGLLRTKSQNVNGEEKKKDDTPPDIPVKTYASALHTMSAGATAMIVPVWVSHVQDPTREILVYAMLDSQSDTTFIKSDLHKQLGVSGSSVNLRLSTLTSENQLISSHKVTGLVLRGYTSEERLNLPPVYTRDVMPADRTHIPCADTARSWPHLERIADEMQPLLDCDVALLVGYNCPKALVPREVIPDVNGGPYAQRTDLGWAVVGIVSPSSHEGDVFGVSHRVLAAEEPLVADVGRATIVLRTSIKEVVAPVDVAKMMALDFNEYGVDSEDSFSQEDLTFIKTMKEGVHQDASGHYSMPLPLRGGSAQLLNNMGVVRKRLDQLRRKLIADSHTKELYTQFMSDMLVKGYAEEVPDADVSRADGKVWYLPHHGVFHPKKPGKIRIVFDCSAKYGGDSLNQHLLQGPDLTNKLIGVLLRFRGHEVAIMCDIEAMFMQFHVHAEQRDLLRFLWWENGDLDSSPKIYRMKVHLFGAASSPACANFALKQLAEDNVDAFSPTTIDFLQRSFYVDDGLRSLPTVAEAVSLVQEARSMCKIGGLRLHKFVSNSVEVLESIPSEERSESTKDLDLLDGSSERALGMYWRTQEDILGFRLTLKEQPCTRRGILSVVSSIYDPLGFVAPVILVGKQILQEMCQEGTDWDAPLSEHLKPLWAEWRSDVVHLVEFKIPRCFNPPDFGLVTEVELHHFADASCKGYGTASYLRMMNTDGDVHCTLAMGKSRVTPLKATTIPRLELTAATVAVRVSLMLEKELPYANLTHHFWTDSKVVLGYINNVASRFHVFVANRVQYIRDHTEPKQWNYVPTDENPADIASRGCTAEKLACNTVWLQGPAYLLDKDLPKVDSELQLSHDDPEVRKCAFATKVKGSDLLESVRFAPFSSWQKLKRTVSYILQLKAQLLKKTKGTKSVVAGLQSAETAVIKVVQREAFFDEVRVLSQETRKGESDQPVIPSGSPLYQLDPFLDGNGVLRVGGRLCASDLPYELKHPVILPNKHHVSMLIIRDCHEQTQHQGRGVTVNSVRDHGYWVIGCSSMVRRYVFNCVVCRRTRGVPEVQKMADLPTDRFQEAPPFTYSAVDLFGPWYIREGRKDLKRYGVLFTCMACRAVHIETTNSLETAAFINALRRFIAVRGSVRQLRCDQGTNFVGAERELRETVNEMDEELVRNTLLSKQCDYVHFEMNVPSASHMGGVWERQIRTVRSVLSSILMQAGPQLCDESLRTFMAEAAAIVNGRPLCTDGLNDPTSLVPITPNQLLTMKSGVVLPPPGKFQREDLYSRKRWRRVQHLANEFWARWRKEYIQNLQARSKWQKPKRDLQVGDVVIVSNDTLARNQWQLARVVETMPSKDGRVRKVRIAMADTSLDKKGKRTQSQTYLERPVHKLVLLVEADTCQSKLL